MKDFVILDTETTGIQSTDEVIELGIVASDGTVLFDELFRPTVRMSDEAAKVTGISQEMLDASRLIFGNPMLLVGADFRYLAYTDEEYLHPLHNLIHVIISIICCLEHCFLKILIHSLSFPFAIEDFPHIDVVKVCKLDQN